MTSKRHHYCAQVKSPNQKPTVLIFPTWSGITSFEKGIADEIFKWGFNTIAIDLYGEENTPETVEEKASKMHALTSSPNQLRNTIDTMIDEALSLQKIKPDEVFCIGYCLGGKLSLMAGLNNEEITRAISVHGLLDITVETPKNRKSSFLILNGYLDPMIAESDKHTFLEQLSKYDLDWHLIEFGQAMHSFTQAEACHPENGVNFHKISASRSLIYTKSFLIE